MTVNVWEELKTFTFTDPKFKEDGLSLTAEFACALAPHRLPRTTIITTGHTSSHDLSVVHLFSWLTDITGSGRGGPWVPSLITRDLIAMQRKTPRLANQLVQRTVLVQELRLIPGINQPLYGRRNWQGVRRLPSGNHAVPQSALGHRRKLGSCESVIEYRRRKCFGDPLGACVVTSPSFFSVTLT